VIPNKPPRGRRHITGTLGAARLAPDAPLDKACPAARAGEPANACLGRRRLSDDPNALLFPDSQR
jgi:hypothetical protein